jgi:hypothetical protein
LRGPFSVLRFPSEQFWDRGGAVLRFAANSISSARTGEGPDGRQIRLRPRPRDAAAVYDAGRVLSKQELMEAVWPNIHVGEQPVPMHPGEHRAGDDRREMIRVIVGRGYVLDIEVTTAPADVRPRQGRITRNDRASNRCRYHDSRRAGKTRWPFGLRGPAMAAALAGLCAVVRLQRGSDLHRISSSGDHRRPLR